MGVRAAERTKYKWGWNVFCMIVIVGPRALHERNTTFHSTFSPLFEISISDAFSFDNINENSVSYFYWATFTSQHGLTTGSAHSLPLNYINNIIMFSHETPGNGMKHKFLGWVHNQIVLSLRLKEADMYVNKQVQNKLPQVRRSR